MSPNEEYEQRRLNALRSYDLLDSVSEKEYDELTELAAQICGTPVALVSLIDKDRQWFKSAHGTDLTGTPRDTSICSTAIENPAEPLIIPDARKDARFSEYATVKGSPNVAFYAGIPLVDSDNYALGTLCVIDQVERKLSEKQLQGLKTLASNVVNLIELRKKNKQLEQEKKSIKAALELNSSFFLILNLKLEILSAGANFSKVIPGFSAPCAFDEFFQFEGQFSWERFLADELTEYSKLLFIKVKNRNQRYKCAVIRIGDELILSCSPVINAQFALRDYNLTLNDFPQHDYIAEYLFLQQTTSRSLEDSKNLMQKLIERNKLLEVAQKDIDTLSKFPQENPNAVLRFDYDHKLIFYNAAATTHFLADFNLVENKLNDESIDELLNASQKFDKENSTKVISRNDRHYSITAVAIAENKYINIYVKDITAFVEEVNQKEIELSRLKDEITAQKDFYEYILNNIPADIGVFDKNHKYVFVNPNGIKNPEIREFMIGKDDFDYCKFRGIPDDLAHARRKVFNSILESKKIISWEDEIITKEGERVVVLREMGPLFDEDGNVKYVVGYGIHITDRKLAEEELKRANERMTLLQNFLNKTSDAIQVVDTAGNTIYLNDMASKRLGIPADEAEKYHVTDYEGRFKEPGSWQEHVKQLSENGEMQIEGESLNQQTGEIIPIEVNVKYEVIQNKAYIIAATRDISERKNAEAREYERNQRLMNRQRTLVDLSQLPSQLPLDDRLKIILERNAEIMKVGRVGFWYLSKNEELIKCDYIFDSSSQTFLDGVEMVTSDYPAYFEQLALNDGMIIANDTFVHPATEPFKESYLKPLGIRSMMDIPVRIGERILGIISHEHIGEPREWQKDEITFARSIADLVALTLENSEREKAERSLIAKSIFQNLLMEISTKYINLPVEEVDEAINISLEKIGEYVDVDRVYIFNYMHDDKTCSCIYEWCAEGVSQEIDNLQGIPYEEIPIWYDAHQHGNVYHVPNVSELTDQLTKDILEPQGIKSMIAFPLMQNNIAVGFVGFDAVRSVRDFSDDERSLLMLYSQMLANVNMRINQLREIERSKQAIEQINEDLEAIVVEKTKSNLELAKSITDQEKLVTLGEISSGIAHDLNTPLGAIKSGAESVRYTLEQLFKGSIWKCNESQITEACTIAVESEDDLFIGGLQQIRETRAMEEILLKNYSNVVDETELKTLSSALVKARFKPSDEQFISELMAIDNRLDYLDVILQMKTIRTLVDTILKSSDRASRVVQDLRSFIKEQKSTKRTTIDLNQNIGTVLNIFNFELTRVANVEFSLSENCTIEGYDIKLFQLWSNLIKNAVEAMEETGQRGLLRIYDQKKDKGITIIVENNGPKIPEEIQSEIFNKFYTTKSAKNGTGLGLNIVKNIIQDHNAKIELDSTDERTQFKITFSR
jgi:PAS domain S-box-containing protein